MLLKKDEACLFIFNMQLELIPLLRNSYQTATDAVWLADLFETHSLPTFFIEHKKLGAILPDLLQVAPSAKRLEKYHFSISKEPEIMSQLESLNKKQLIFAGAEAHVCMLQSAEHLKNLGYEIFFVSDALSARNNEDLEIAKIRLLENKHHLITKEMLFFELIDHSEFKNYLNLSLKFLDGRYIKHKGL